MALKAVYPDKETFENEVEEAFRELYHEVGGEWKLKPNAIEGVKTQADVERVQRALDQEKSAHKETKEKFSRFDGLDADDVFSKLDRFDELEAAAEGKIDEAKLNEMVEARIAGRLKPVQRELETTKSEMDKLREQNESLTGEKRLRKISDAVREAATRAKLKDGAVEDALILAERIFEVTEDGKVLVKDQVGYTPGVDPEVWLTSDMREKRSHWWPESHGGGAPGAGPGAGGGGNNPFAADTWNLTEQGRLLKENPDRAHQLAKAAGTAVGGGRPVAKK